MRVKEYYRQAISNVLTQRGIASRPIRTEHKIQPNATIETALRYTHWYSDKADTKPHYRYRRYLNALLNLGPIGDRLTHVDIGCGAGPFSWSFLDWALGWGSNYRKINLFGIDRCPNMIRAAKLIRDELAQMIPNYPSLHYYHDVEPLLSGIRATRHQNADSIITIGHVLAQSHTPEDIRGITNIIVQVRGLTDPIRRCLLAAVDAKGHSCSFLEGWGLLLDSLKEANISCTTWAAPAGINTPNDAKLASL